MRKSTFLLIILASFLLLSSIASAQFKLMPLDIISNFFNTILKSLGLTAATTAEKTIPSSGNIAYPTSCDSRCKAQGQGYVSGICKIGSYVNLAVIPYDWHLTYGSGPQIIFKDDDVVRTSGKPSIRLEPHTSSDVNTARECDGKWYSVKPGDHIIAKCWIKIDSGAYNAFSGARIGIDLYNQEGGNNYLLWAVGVPTYRNPEVPAEESAAYVHWGTPGWTERVIDFIVPSDFFTYNYMPGKTGTIPPTQVSHFVMWLQVWGPQGGTELGNAWFADTELYINPPCQSGWTSIGPDGCNPGEICCCS